MAITVRTAPKPPVSVTATAVITSTANATSYMRVQWPAPPSQPRPISALNLYRRGVLLEQLPASERSYMDTTAAVGISYSYAVSVVSTTVTESARRSSSGAPRVPRRPVWSADTPAALTLADGGQYSFASTGSHPDGLAVTYSLVNGAAGYSCTLTGMLTAGSASATLTLRLTSSDGLYEDRSLAVTVSAVSGADFVIPVSTASRTFDGDNASSGFGGAQWRTVGGVNRAPTAGDIIELAAGTHGPMVFQDLTGNSGAGGRITIRGPQSGAAQAVIRRNSPGGGGFIVNCLRSSYVTMNGRNTSLPNTEAGKYQCGIKVMYATGATSANKDQPTTWFKGGGRCHHATFSYIEVDGGNMVQGKGAHGCQFNDHSAAYSRNLAANAGLWVEDLQFDHWWLHGCTSGFYVGPNYDQSDLPLRRITIEHNRIENVEEQGISGKSWWTGPNHIRHNYIHTTGLDKSGNAIQRAGITILGTATVNNNWLQNVGDGVPGLSLTVPNGIRPYVYEGPLAGVAEPNGFGTYSTFEIWIYNNVVVGTIENGLLMGSSAGAVKFIPYIFNNTLVSSGDYGLVIDNADGNNGWIRNNVIAGNNNGGTQALYGVVSQANNLTQGSLSGLFENAAADNYHLASPQAASGTVGTDIAATDYDGDSRAQGSADKGAYEYP